jgi:malonyl-CoA O-methyltransferase
LPDAPTRTIDQRVIARMLQRAAGNVPPWLHEEVARRMAQRLPVILSTPHTLLQWWGHLSASDALLQAAYPKAQRILVEPTPALLHQSRVQAESPWWSVRRWRGHAVRVVHEEDVLPGSAELLWSNMMLHAVADPPALMARWRRALSADGFLMFSTLGPDTLAELRALYVDLGWPPPAAAFVDMHDLGDMLVRAGFADPVMDQEKLTLTWADPVALLAELRGLGANTEPRRAPGLRTPRWKQRLVDAIDARKGADGRFALSFELVFGHAFNAPPRVPMAPQSEVALQDMRAMVRARRGGPRP